MLSLKFKICPSEDCKSFKIIDTTGIYDAVDNPGGWGGPNMDPASVTSAFVRVFLPGVDENDPTNGITIDITSNLNSVILPSYIPGYTFEVTTFSNQNLNNNCNLEDGVWNITYMAGDNASTFESHVKYVHICAVQCCVDKMLEKAIDARLCGKKCDDNSIKQALTARALLLQAIKYSTGCADFKTVQKIINSAKKLCNLGTPSTSGGCGCGCS